MRVDREGVAVLVRFNTGTADAPSYAYRHALVTSNCYIWTLDPDNVNLARQRIPAWGLRLEATPNRVDVLFDGGRGAWKALGLDTLMGLLPDEFTADFLRSHGPAFSASWTESGTCVEHGLLESLAIARVHRTDKHFVAWLEGTQAAPFFSVNKPDAGVELATEYTYAPQTPAEIAAADALTLKALEIATATAYCPTQLNTWEVDGTVTFISEEDLVPRARRTLSLGGGGGGGGPSPAAAGTVDMAALQMQLQNALQRVGELTMRNSQLEGMLLPYQKHYPLLPLELHIARVLAGCEHDVNQTNLYQVYAQLTTPQRIAFLSAVHHIRGLERVHTTIHEIITSYYSAHALEPGMDCTTDHIRELLGLAGDPEGFQAICDNWLPYAERRQRYGDPEAPAAMPPDRLTDIVNETLILRAGEDQPWKAWRQVLGRELQSILAIHHTGMLQLRQDEEL